MHEQKNGVFTTSLYTKINLPLSDWGDLDLLYAFEETDRYLLLFDFIR